MQTLKTHLKIVVTIGCEDDENLGRCIRKAHGSPLKRTLKLWIKGKRNVSTPAVFSHYGSILPFATAANELMKQTRFQTTQVAAENSRMSWNLLHRNPTLLQHQIT